MQKGYIEMKKEFTIVFIFALLLGLSGIFIGCKQKEAAMKEEAVEEETVGADTQAPEPEALPPASADNEVKIEAVPNSPEFPGAKARFSSLKDGDLLEDPYVSVVVDVENFELGAQTDTERAKEIMNSAQGQHAHIILDNDPYLADYESGKPFEIGVLREGPHTLVAFPSRSYHESVKSPEAADIVNFYVGKKEGGFMLDKSKPAIIYSRPKGTYEGAGAEMILLDFYLNNVELGPDGYKAKYTIRKKDSTGEVTSIILTDWAPAYVTGLTTGDYAVKLELLDSDGNTVEGVFNNTEREISVVRE
ncbi:MAG TPA: hypothetical protein VLG45_11320 [Thermodesulfobacteriota bacterium]|nr:hypothetical protein [Thermodesulfobacteriota bacterium]